VKIVAVPTSSITKSAPGFVTLLGACVNELGVARKSGFANNELGELPSGTNNPVIVPTTEPAKFFRLLKQ
jgi:hypothetical protein